MATVYQLHKLSSDLHRLRGQISLAASGMVVSLPAECSRLFKAGAESEV